MFWKIALSAFAALIIFPSTSVWAGGASMEIISTNPESPAVLEAGKYLHIEYRYDKGGTNANEVNVVCDANIPGLHVHDEHDIKTGKGVRMGYIRFDSATELKSLKLIMNGPDEKKGLRRIFEKDVPVDFRWKAPKGTSTEVKAQSKINPVKQPDDKKNTSQNKFHYDLLEIPPGRGSGFSDMVIDESNTVWIMAHNKLFYLDGNEFKEPKNGSFGSGYYLARLYGGPKQGAYATQEGKGGNFGKVYKLNKGRAEYLTDFYYEMSSEYPGVYVSKNGRLINWGQRFLATYNGKDWDRIEAVLATQRPLRIDGILDTGKDVYFYHEQRLYCVTAEGKIEQRKCPKTNKGTSVALWGKQRALLLNRYNSSLFAFDLVTGEQTDLSAVAAESEPFKFLDAHSLNNGEVLFRGIFPFEKIPAYFLLSVDGKLSEIYAMRGIETNRLQYRRIPNSVLDTSNGRLFFGYKIGQISFIKNGRLNRLDLKYGFQGYMNNIHEDLEGNVYFPAERKIARLPARDIAAAIESKSVKWQNFTLKSDSSRLLETKPGHIAMIRADKKGFISRWDGSEWEYQEVPFDTEKSKILMTDSREHVFCMTDYPWKYYDAGPEIIVEHEKFNSILTGAVDAGVKDFCPYDTSSTIVTDDKRIWRGGPKSDFSYYDGTRWDRYWHGYNNEAYQIFNSEKHEILVWSRGGFYRYDRGWWVKAEPPLHELRLRMIGENGLQPYEREMIDAHPGKYYPVLYDDKKMYLFFSADEFEEGAENEDFRKSADFAELPSDAMRFSASRSGGGWVYFKGKHKMPLRLFQRKLYQVNINYTPLAGKQVIDIKEDAEGGIWFLTEKGRQVYYCEMP